VEYIAGAPRIEVEVVDGSRRVIPGLQLDRATSAGIFNRDGLVRRLDVYLGAA
jgi:hypothetical protein